MRRFQYEAKDIKTGRIIRGTVQAENERAAGKLLVEQNYVPEKISDESDQGLFAKLNNRITGKDKVMFSRQFATLIGAGLPLTVSLRTVAEQTQRKPMRIIIEEILASVESGRTLADSMAEYPKVFDNVFLSLVRAGEASGTLDEALRRLADQQEKDAAMLSKVRGAMIYPAIILAVIVAVLAFMMIAVVPEVEHLYKDMGKPLPVLTVVLVAISNFFAQFWWLILIIVIFLVWGFMHYRQTTQGIRTMANIKLNVPIFKKLFRLLYMSRFARTMQMLLQTGVSMLDAMYIAGRAINNVVVEDEIKKAAEQVKGGKPLSESLADKDYILPLVPQMAKIGEQSGQIDDMLGRAGKVYSDELDEQVAAISTLIEPILLVVMAILIGVVIGGTLLPIYSLVSSI